MKATTQTAQTYSQQPASGDYPMSGFHLQCYYERAVAGQVQTIVAHNGSGTEQESKNQGPM